jgi:DNA helicase-2/ATP-dependent DNA helicase PcrA
MMSSLIKAKSSILETAHIQLKDTAVLSEISKAKAREETPDGMAMRAATDPSSSTNTLSFIAEVSFSNRFMQELIRQLYGEYEAALREANSLDFDDLLVFGLRLFRTAPRVISHCRHILVDEFQVGYPLFFYIELKARTQTQRNTN